MKGGKHVDHVVKKLVKPLVEEVNKKAKKLKNAELNTKQVKQHLFVFVNCLIEVLFICYRLLSTEPCL